jgi:hypothetical protein
VAITLTQTDTASDLAASVQLCSAISTFASAGAAAKAATVGGTAGVTAISTTIHVGTVTDNFGWLYSDAGVPNNTSWEAGTWTVRCEVTTANANITVLEAQVCRVNSSGTNQASVISGAGALVLGANGATTTGVKSGSASGSAQAGSAAGDRMAVVLTAKNTLTSMPTAFSWKPSQNIDTPVTQNGGAVFMPRPAPVVRQAVTRASYW